MSSERTYAQWKLGLMSGAAWCAGPIFTKELRVTSRRVRYYLLRAVYAGAMASLIMLTWHSSAHSGSAVVAVSRMPVVAMTVTTAITWLQFLAAQGLAVLLLSSTIGEEIRKGTLGALLTTPITSFQMVLGKLLGRMLHVLVLLAISLPVLAILRLLGGVPAAFLLAGACVTLATALFAGMLSLYLSTWCRYGSKTISAVLLIGVCLFVVPEIVLIWGRWLRISGIGAMLPVVQVTNPFRALYLASFELWHPAAVATRAYAPWMLNSFLMLALALGLLPLTVRRVRRAAIAASTGGERTTIGALVGRAVRRLLGGSGARVQADHPAKRVTGSPILWKETRRGLLYGWSLSDIVICVIALAGAVVPVIVFDLAGSEPTAVIGLIIAWGLSILMLFRLAVECAGNVPHERETRTWPILLTTLLEDREIVRGKVKAALLRNAPVLVTLVVLALFVLAVFPRVETLWFTGWGLVSLATSSLLAIGTGSYFGVTIKTRTSAVVTTVVVCLILKYGIGWMFIPLAAVAAAGAGRQGAVWGVVGFLVGMVAPAVIHAIIGVAGIRVASQRVRRDVF